MEQAFRSYFRPPADAFRFERIGGRVSAPGWFRCGGAIGYGSLTGIEPAVRPDDELPEVDPLLEIGDGVVRLPFDPDEVVDNLRCERYVPALARASSARWRALARRPYYLVRPLLPVAVRKHMQRRFLSDWRALPFPAWPADTSVDRLLTILLERVLLSREEPLPWIWFWPDAARGCALMTHDVETAAGRDRCIALAELDGVHGLRSAFQFVPEGRYAVPPDLIRDLTARGCDVNVHGLNHDGHLFRDRDTFVARTARIREHAVRFGASGFRSPVLYRRPEWLDEMGFVYDMTLPNVGHLDPQRGGCCTVMPFLLGATVELPLTTTQDYSLLHILDEPRLDLWRAQLERIRAACGLACFNIHPDYLDHPAATSLYRELLEFLARSRQEHRLWSPSPDDAAAWWQRRSTLTPRRDGGGWVIDGDEDRAVVALASRDDAGLRFDLAGEAYRPPLAESVPRA